MGRLAQTLGLMKTAALCLLLLTPLLALAGIDKPWQEDDPGGGTLPGASWLFGTIAAGYLVFQGFKDGESLGNILTAAMIGFCIGGFLGLPVGCMLR